MSEAAKKRRVKRGWMNLEVVAIVNENPTTKTLYFVDHEERGCVFDYVPGQYLTFRFDSLSAKPVVRSYTMSSSPYQKDAIAVTVRQVEEPFISEYLCQKVKKGDVLRARGPIGRFVYEPNKDHKHLVMVAGGSGVTPFISIMREYAPYLGGENSPQKMTLFVTFRSEKELMCWKEVEELRKIKGIQIIVTLSRQEQVSNDRIFLKGRVTPEILKDSLQGSYENKTYMTCGPQGLMDLVKKHLTEAGVAQEHIKLESFD